MTTTTINAVAELARQRSHVIFSLCQCAAGTEEAFRPWYQDQALGQILGINQVLRARHYEQGDVDITRGRHPRLPYRYLGMYDLSVDGAEEAAHIVEQIHSLHQKQPLSESPATWLYYPLGERVGLPSRLTNCMLTLAFANAVGGQEEEFREWYVTRHLRHALNIPALVNGQCFYRTAVQRPGTREADFAMIAVYEQEGSAESIVDSFLSLPPETFRFPMMDRNAGRFAEWSYRCLSEG
jgi:hypothetical protein